MPVSSRGGYDIWLAFGGNQRGFLLNKDENNNLIYRPGLSPSIVPPLPSGAFTYTSIHPAIEYPLGFEDWTGGAGWDDVDMSSGERNALRVYNYSQGVDLSWGIRGYISPQVQTGGAVTSTNPRKFIWSEEFGLFAINTRFVYEWTGAAWTERLDAGASATLTDLIEYTNIADTYLLVGSASGVYRYSTDGITWTSVDLSASAPAHRASTTAEVVSGTTITPTEPAGATTDDVLLATVNCTSGRTITPTDSGWTSIGAQEDTGNRVAIFWLRRTASAPSYVFTVSGAAGPIVAGVSAYSGAITLGVPIDVSAFTTNVSGTSHTIPSVTTTVANTRLYFLLSVTSAGAPTTITPPGSATERYEADPATNWDQDTEASDQAQAAVGATGTFTATTGGAVTTVTANIAIRAAANAPDRDTIRWAVRGASSGNSVLWSLSSSGDVRNSVNPTLASSWSAADTVQVGQDRNTIAGMLVIDNTFYIFRDTEIVSYNGTTVSTVYSSPTFRLSSNSARPFLWVDGKVYFTYSGVFYAFEQLNNTITRIWPAKAGNAELNGTITAIGGDETNLFFALRNSAGNTYIMKGDPRKGTISLNGIDVYPFHTWAYRGAVDCNALLILPADADSFSTTNPHIVIASGNNGNYIILPRAGLRPEDDANYLFDTTASRPIYGPYVSWGAKAFHKDLNLGAVIGSGMTANLTIAIQYQAAGGTATTLATATAAGRTAGAPTAAVEFTTLRYVALMSTNVNTSAPVLFSLALHATLKPPRRRLWYVEVLVGDNLTLNTGGLDTQGARDLELFLFGADAAGLRMATSEVTVYDLFENTYNAHLLEAQGLGVKRVGDRELMIVGLTLAETR